MKKVKTDKPTFRENLQNMFRSYRILYELDKKFFFMQILNGINHQARIYVNAWIAALVINGVMAGKPIKTLIVYTVVAVFANLIMNVITQITAARRYIRKSMWEKLLTDLFHRKSEKMDYPNFEDTELRKKWNRIANQFGNYQGIGDAYNSINVISICVTAIVMSASIIFSFFGARPTNEKLGSIASFFSSPWMIPIFFIIFFMYIYFSGKIWKYMQNYHIEWDKFYGTEPRRIIKLSAFELDNKKAMDRKIYGLDEMIIKEDCLTLDKAKKTAIKIYKGSLVKYDILKCACSCFLGVFLYVLIALKVYVGAVSIGSVVLYITAFTQWQTSWRDLINRFTACVAAEYTMFRDQYSYLDMEQKMYHGTLSVEKRSDRQYQVEFRDVSFRYPGATDYALRHVNFKFHVGQRLAVVGMNGSGKTTFIKLMCRLYDPTEGTILLNGIDIKKYDYDEYMAIFSVVFQDFRLFAYPLAENVAATKNYDTEKVQACLRDVGLSDRVSEMKHGIETCLYRSYDPEGVEISGGEAQKIALSRALYKNAPFIILDEPTASPDPLAEADIYSHFNDIVGDKTAIYISHRLSSCRFCDIIAVFHEGEIIEVGTHDELVADTSSKYYELWNAQAQYYTETDKQKA